MDELLIMICTECVYPIPVKKHITLHGAFDTCQYCRKPGMCLSKLEVIVFIKHRMLESFRHIDELSQFEQAMFYRGSDSIPMSEYWQIIQDDYPLGVEPFVIEAIEHLEAEFAWNEAGGVQMYALDDGTLQDNVYEREWEKFVADTHHGYRYFNDDARFFLDSLFQFTCNQKTLKPELITAIDSTTSIFRARKISPSDDLSIFEKAPETALGPAPQEKAGDQRMTPSGISAMYCALDRKTCLSEIRSVTGDIVISGAFSPINEINLLNLKKLEELARFETHPFEVGYKRASHAYHFLKKLIFKLSKPKSNGDALGYVSTQIVFEYIRLRYGKQVSGIIFPSVQTGLIGTNIVIFPECARVASSEYKPPAVADIFPWEDPPVLRFNGNSVMVHKIKAVTTQSQDFMDLTDYRIDAIMSQNEFQ